MAQNLVIFLIVASALIGVESNRALRAGKFCRVFLEGVNNGRSCDHECQCIDKNSPCRNEVYWPAEPLPKSAITSNSDRTKENCEAKLQCGADKRACCRKRLTTFNEGTCSVIFKGKPSPTTTHCYCEVRPHLCTSGYITPNKSDYPAGADEKVQECNRKIKCDPDEEPCCKQPA